VLLASFINIGIPSRRSRICARDCDGGRSCKYAGLSGQWLNRIGSVL